MKCDKKSLLLYAVTDRSWLKGNTLASQVQQALEGGATFIQLREKELDEGKFLEEARALKVLCKEYGVPFVINDNVEIAKRVDADGVHVGQKDMEASNARELLGPDKIIGVSVQTVEQAIRAEKDGADYLGVGAVFITDSKADAEHVSLDTLKAITKAVNIPVIAIGGINEKNAIQLKDTGICGIAVISAIFAQNNIRQATKTLKKVALESFGQKMKVALTIAGSDSSGGAGIQADIKTMLAHHVYGMSAITSLTAQNTRGVSDVMTTTPDFLAAQLDNIFTDIYPDAVKIGMVAAKELAEVIAQKLIEYKAKNIVVDPVMVATSGAKLISDSAISVLEEKLFPLADVLTPNIPEAEVIAHIKINSPEDMIRAAAMISEQYHCAVLCKGGHRLNDANDLLYSKGTYKWFYGKRIDNPNTHGTGCTLSSAIASNLAKGYSLEEAIEKAKRYISGALDAMLDLGEGNGPMDHGFGLQGEY